LRADCGNAVCENFEVELRPAGTPWGINFLADLNGDGKADLLLTCPGRGTSRRI